MVSGAVWVVIVFTGVSLLLSVTTSDALKLNRENLLYEITEIKAVTNDLYVEMLERAIEQNHGFAISEQDKHALRARINRAVVAHTYASR